MYTKLIYYIRRNIMRIVGRVLTGTLYTIAILYNPMFVAINQLINQSL